MMSRRAVLTTVLGLMLLTSLPFLAAGLFPPEGKVFGGFLFNPQDGLSYLAKMQQGGRGHWLFVLPYTAEPGAGTPLFLFYLGLGHLARWLGLSFVVTFHAVRVLGAGLLGLALARFYRHSLPRRAQGVALVLGAFGSGLGWLALPLGELTADWWVAEAYPFLSAFATPHFGLGLALLLHLLTPGRRGRWGLAGDGLAALALGLMAPFGVVVAGVVLVSLMAWEAWAGRRGGQPGELTGSGELTGRMLVVGLCGGLPVLAAQWVAVRHPVLAGWNAQNLTPTPPVWDLGLAFSPALVLAGVALLSRVKASRRLPEGKSGAPLGITREEEAAEGEAARVLWLWAALGLALAFLPLGLQRRFLMGLMAPLAGLGALGLQALETRRGLRLGLLAAAFPTTLILLMGAFGLARSAPAGLYLEADEAAALRWLDLQPAGGLVLASPEMGAYIPAYSGQRVLWGHPFETVPAEQELAGVLALWQGLAGSETLARRGVDWVLVGGRERALFTVEPGWLSEYPVVWSQGAVQILRVR